MLTMAVRKRKATRARALGPEATKRVVSALERLIERTGSQSGAAKALDMSQGAVSQVLAGAPVGFMFTAAVADALEMSVSELIGWDEVAATADPYRERAAAVASARRIGIPESAILVVQQMKVEGSPSGEWWMRRILEHATNVNDPHLARR